MRIIRGITTLHIRIIRGIRTPRMRIIRGIMILRIIHIYAEFLIFLIRNDPVYNTYTRDHDSTYAYYTRDHDSAYTYYTRDHDSAYNTYTVIRRVSYLVRRISPWNQKRIVNCFSMSIRDPYEVVLNEKNRGKKSCDTVPLICGHRVCVLQLYVDIVSAHNSLLLRPPGNPVSVGKVILWGGGGRSGSDWSASSLHDQPGMATPPSSPSNLSPSP